MLSTQPSTSVLSSAWMPLDGLIQEWGAFGADQASTAPALHAVGMAFCAIAHETTARSYYTAAWHASQDGDLTELEHALEELLPARQYWTDAMLSLELLLLDSTEEQTSQSSLCSLLAGWRCSSTRPSGSNWPPTVALDSNGREGVRPDWPATGKVAGQRASSRKHAGSVVGCSRVMSHVGALLSSKKGSAHAYPMGR